MMAWQLPASSKPRWRSESMGSPSADLRLNPLYVMNGTSHKPPGLAAPVLYLSSQDTSDISVSHWPSAVQPRPSHVSTRVGGERVGETHRSNRLGRGTCSPKQLTRNEISAPSSGAAASSGPRRWSSCVESRRRAACGAVQGVP